MSYTEELLEKANEVIPRVTLEDFNNDQNSKLMIDVRQHEELVASGSIKGSIHIPKGVIEFKLNNNLEQKKNLQLPERKSWISNENIEIYDFFTKDDISSLEHIDFLTSGYGLLLASLEADPLDPDVWWKMACESQNLLTEFLDRTSKLDLRDRRANLLFSRRIERIRDSGDEDQFIRLSKIILAQRPTNHEAWASLGRMHERRKEYSDAWLCYDQAQICFPTKPVRDEFKSRMEAELDGKGKRKWKSPGINQRVDFLRKMEDMATPDGVYVNVEDDVDEDPIREVEELVNEGRLSEAFFMTRRMAAQGIEGALEINQELRKKMERV